MQRILLHWIRTSKELQSPLRLLVMASSCAGLILHLGSGSFRGDSFNPKVCCWREKNQQQPKIYHSGPILVTQNLVAYNEYPSVTRKVLTWQLTGPRRRRTHDPSSVDRSTPYCERANHYATTSLKLVLYQSILFFLNIVCLTVQPTSSQHIVRYAMTNTIAPYAGGDSDSCADNKCSVLSTCIPEGDSYRCACKEGYEGDGAYCQVNSVIRGTLNG
jgi:hypothetical protein